MLQLRVTDDRGAVTEHLLETFPYLIGRSPRAQLQITAPGVWDTHASIRLTHKENHNEQRFVIEPVSESLLLINGSPSGAIPLSLGVEITIGAARIVVSLAPAHQTGLQFHERLVWALLMLVLLIESAVVHLAR